MTSLVFMVLISDKCRVSAKWRSPTELGSGCDLKMHIRNLRFTLSL